jgi:glutamate racemase
MYQKGDRMDNRRIGVFDSGIGGLTCLSDLIEKFPYEDFLYLADTLNCPYGIKSKSELEAIVSKNIKFFEAQDVKAIVIACNTATANSYHLQSSVPIIRIIEPTATQANALSQNVGVLATNYTIDSKIYNRYLTGNVIGVRCSDFVSIVEEGLMGTQQALEVVKQKVLPLKGKVDTIILGCTHFGLLTKEIKAVLGDVKIVDSSLAIAPVLKEILKGQEADQKLGKVEILTTKDTALKISWFNKPYHSIKVVNI